MLDLIIRGSLSVALISAVSSPIIGELFPPFGMVIALTVATVLLVVAAISMLFD